MTRALVLAGTGVVGIAVARHLAGAGWRVDVTGRDPQHAGEEIARPGVTFLRSDRHDAAQLALAVGAGADLVVDCGCFTAAHADQLVGLLGDVGSTVMLSSKAVYVDERGRHVNSLDAPHFTAPITEAQPTLAPGAGDYQSRDGYGANKVAAEQVLLSSGFPVSVVRASKVHGVGARRPREWYFVRRVLDRRPRVVFDSDAPAGDHPTAAVNVAALVEFLAAHPGTRVLNCADPDAPSEREIARVVADHFAHDWDVVVVAGSATLGRSPWHHVPPIVLDTSASRALGYRPVGGYAATVAPTLEWLAAIGARSGTRRLPALFDNDFFEGSFDYDQEDDALGDASAPR